MFPHFQAQKEHGVEDPYYCLSDFVAPLDSNVKDYVGCFAVSIMGAEEMAKKYVTKRLFGKKWGMLAITTIFVASISRYLDCMESNLKYM